MDMNKLDIILLLFVGGLIGALGSVAIKAFNELRESRQKELIREVIREELKNHK